MIANFVNSHPLSSIIPVQTTPAYSRKILLPNLVTPLPLRVPPTLTLTYTPPPQMTTPSPTFDQQPQKTLTHHYLPMPAAAVEMPSIYGDAIHILTTIQWREW
jgi:hypothetical protein